MRLDTRNNQKFLKAQLALCMNYLRELPKMDITIFNLQELYNKVVDEKVFEKNETDITDDVLVITKQIRSKYGLNF